MKKEKKYVIIVLILIIILIAQLVYYRVRNGIENKKRTENIISVDNLVDKIPVSNIEVALSEYNGQVTKEKLGESIGVLALKTIEEIREQTRDKTTAEIEKYYDENKALISSKEIASKDAFVSIAEEVNNYASKGNLIFKNSKVEVAKDEEEDNDYYKLYLNIEYNNDIVIHLKCYLSKSNNTIVYLSNSQVEQLYKIYKGVASKNELYATINEFKNNVQWIRENTKLVSVNNQLKFYSDNQERINRMGIYSSEDFIKISTLMSNNIEWKNNTELNYYAISLESFKEEGDYSSIEIDFIYDYIEQLNLKIELTNVEKAQERIKFTTLE